MNETVLEFLEYLKIPVSRRFCERIIASHPDFPSMLSIVDALDRLQIKYLAARVDLPRLNEVEFPYLLRLNKGQGEIIIVKSSKDLAIKKDDLEYWDGIVLKVEPTKHIADEDNKRLYRIEQLNRLITRLSGVAVLLMFGAAVTFVRSIDTAFLSFFSIVGVGVGYLLIAKDFGIRYDAVEQFCAAGVKADCDAVLSSEGAKLFGLIGLSEIALSYFASQAIFLLLSFMLASASLAIISPLAILSLLTIPVVVYSIYYQYFIVKSWCKLCLLIDAILCVQVAFFMSSLGGMSSFSISLHPFITLAEACTFCVIACACIFAKNYYESADELKAMLFAAARIKNSPVVFETLLKRQHTIDELSAPVSELYIGTKDAPVSIIMVSNLYCHPCKGKHETMSRFVNMYPGMVSVTFRFVRSKEEDANQYLLQYWWRYIRNSENESETTQKFIHDWYLTMDLEQFKKRYAMEIIEGFVPAVELEQFHKDWNTRMVIRATPTIFINGYLLPKGYEIRDLPSIIPTLEEDIRKRSKSRPVRVQSI